MELKANKKLFSEIQADVKLALLQTGEEVITNIKEAQVVPKAKGTMEKTLEPLDRSEIDNLIIKIHSNTPYAARLYFHPEYNFHRKPWKGGEGNPNARAGWFEPWINGERSKWVSETFAKYLRKNK